MQTSDSRIPDMCDSVLRSRIPIQLLTHTWGEESSNFIKKYSNNKKKNSNEGQSTAGLDIGYVPAGPNAFLRPSGQFGPPQFIFHWPEGPVFFLFC